MSRAERTREQFALRKLRRDVFRRLTASEAVRIGSRDEALLLCHIVDSDDVAFTGFRLTVLRWISRKPRWLQPALVRLLDWTTR